MRTESAWIASVTSSDDADWERGVVEIPSRSLRERELQLASDRQTFEWTGSGAATQGWWGTPDLARTAT